MDSSPPNGIVLGRRERRRRELRDRLYEAAVSLFVEQGYEATTMDSIGERADVARTTVFNHFPQKVQFLEEWGARRRARVMETLERTRTDEQPVAVRARDYLRELARLNLQTRRETAVLIEAAARFGALWRDPLTSLEMERILDAGQRAGEIRADADIAQAAHVLTVGYFTTILRWSTADEPLDLAATCDDMVDMIMRGLLV